MHKQSVLLLAQVDHLTGEDIGWALDILNVPGVRNRNFIPTLTKKGRMGYLILVDVDPDAESAVGNLLLEILNTHGYHRIDTQHIYRKTVTKEVHLLIESEGKSLLGKVRFKRKADMESGPYFLESDDLLSLQGRIHKELGVMVSPLDLKRRIEPLAESPLNEPFHIKV